MLARHRREESVMMREVEEGALYRCSPGPVMIPIGYQRCYPPLLQAGSFALSFEGQALGLSSIAALKYRPDGIGHLAFSPARWAPHGKEVMRDKNGWRG